MLTPEANQRIALGIQQLEGALEKARGIGNESLAELIAADLASIVTRPQVEIDTSTTE